MQKMALVYAKNGIHICKKWHWYMPPLRLAHLVERGIVDTVFKQ